MTALPTGTVTFLFTDIEGSTRLLQRLGADYARVLADHRELLRGTVARHHGREVDTQGDAFFIAFATAGDALACAADVQRAFAGHPWPRGAEVRVRMGLHTGEPEATGSGGYVGLDVHRAARICAAAHGGQILLSQATADLAQGHLPPGARLRDLGDYRLRDLERPEHLYQLVLPDLPADFPPLRTPERRARALPAQPTPLLGREREVAAVRDLLLRDGARLVTLTGPGGIGKTRLSLEVAAGMEDEYADGAYFVELDAVADATLVATAVAQALGLRELGGRNPEESVRAYLAERRALVLLDNFEQVVEAAPLVADLLAACPHLTMLVTSREPLHIRGEQEYGVPPLELPDAPAGTGGSRYDPAEVSGCAAVALFVARARAVRPEFALTEANVGAVVAICRRLDGLPLAIELAAARVKLLTPQAMAARLSRSLDLLVGGGRDVPERQRTLRGAIAWSYDLLTPEERRTFRRMAVFSGGCTLEAAEALCSAGIEADPTTASGSERDADVDSPDVLAHLGSLIDKCLLRQQEDDEGEPRVAMLATIRDYALEQLAASSELAAVRRAHAAYYLELATQAEPHLNGRDQRRWMARLEREHDNLRAALAWARDEGDPATFARLAGVLWRFWYTHGYVTEGRGWLDEALERGGGTGLAAEVRAKLLYGAATLASTQGDAARMRALGRESLEQYRAAGDMAGEAAVLNALGIAALQAGDVAEARGFFEEGLALSRTVGDPWETGRILLSLGQSALREHDLARAAELFEECEALMRRAASISHTAVALLYRGHVARAQGAAARAEAMYREALRLSDEVGDKLRVVRELEALAVIEAGAGQDERAVRLFGGAEGLRETLGTTRHPADAAEVERALANLRGRLDTATFSALWEDGRAQPERRIAEALGA